IWILLNALRQQPFHKSIGCRKTVANNPHLPSKFQCLYGRIPLNRNGRRNGCFTEHWRNNSWDYFSAFECRLWKQFPHLCLSLECLKTEVWLLRSAAI